jgi:amino acid transporter
LAIAWKIFKRTKMHKIEEIDLLTGKAEIDALEEFWVKPVPKNFVEKVS